VELHDAQLFGQSRTLRIKQLLGLDGSTGSLRSRHSGRYSDALVFMAFRGPQAQVNQLRKSSSAASQPSLGCAELRLGRRVITRDGGPRSHQKSLQPDVAFADRKFWVQESRPIRTISTI
jgi:hypothetical protein